MATLVEIARKAHPPGSPEHTRVREYLVDRLTTMGLEPEVQVTSSVRQNERFVRTATVRNVVGRLRGTASTGAVLVTAHYDSREIAVGAGDDGSGVVAILEALRALQTGPALQNDLIVLLTDAEELGLLGARAFVDQHPWMEDVRLAVSIEMRGGSGPSLMFETGEENGWIVRAFQSADPSAVGNSMSYEIYKRLPNDTDFTPFKAAGVQGLNFAAIDRAHVYHQVYDTPANLSESTLQHHGEHALNMLRYLGNQDLASVDAPNVIFFSLPGLGFFVYDQSWVLPLSGILLGLLALGILATRGGPRRVSGIVSGLVLAILGGALSYGVGYLLVTWLPRFHPEFGSLHGSAYHSEGWYMIALVGACLTIVTTLHSVARRWLDVTSLTLGAAIIPLLGAAWLSYAMPLAAMNLQWPVASALSAVVLLAVLKRNAQGVVGWVLAVGLAVPVLVFLEPVVELTWLAMSFQLAGVLAVVITVALYLCLPALEGLRHPNGWWAPTVSLVVGGVALGIGVLTARSTENRPAPSTLVYALDHSNQEALWVTDPSTEGADLASREWAVARAGSAFDEMQDLRDFGYPAGEVPVTEAVLAEVASPEVFTEFSEAVEGVRRVLVGVRSRIGAESLRFQYVTDSNTRLVAINGRALESPDDLVWADHWGEPDPVVVLTLEVPEGEPLQLNIIEHLLRPEELLGEAAFERPDELAPDITRLSDRAMLLTRFTALDQTDDSSPFDLQQVLEAMVATKPDEAGHSDVDPATPVVPDEVPPDTTR